MSPMALIGASASPRAGKTDACAFVGIVYTLPFSSAATNGSNNNEKEDESLIVDLLFPLILCYTMTTRLIFSKTSSSISWFGI